MFFRQTLPTLLSGSGARLCVAAVVASAGLAGTASAKPFEEYIEATPLVAPLSSETWGEDGVVPRDLSNGIESTKGADVHPDYYYWDGQIISLTLSLLSPDR